MVRKKQEVETKEQEHGVSTELFMSLTPKQQRFIHLYSTGQYSNVQLAKLLEVHPNTILSWTKRRDVQEALEEMQEGIHYMVTSQIKNLSVKALDTMNDLLSSPIDGVRMATAKDLLDRAGHKPKNEIKVDKTVTTVEQKLKSLIDSSVSDLIEGEFEEIE